MWKLIAAGLGIVVASIAGIVLGDRWAREDLAETWSLMEQVVEQTRGSAERRMAGEALAVARHLRDGNLASALEMTEATIERHRTAIAADEGTPRATGFDATLLDMIDQYQASFPWSPPAPSAEPTEFDAQFGRLAPHIRDGAVIGYRVTVQPGGVFAKIGLITGDVITHYDGQRVALDRRPRLAEVLESGARVNVIVQGQDCTVRELVVPQR